MNARLPHRLPPAPPADRHGRATAPARKHGGRPLAIAPPGSPGSAHDTWLAEAFSPKPLIRQATPAANCAVRAIGRTVFAIGRPGEAWRAVFSLSLQIIEGKGKERGEEGQHEAGPCATRRDCFAIGDRRCRFRAPSVAVGPMPGTWRPVASETLSDQGLANE